VTVAPDISTAEVKLGTECLEVLQKANAKDDLPESLGPITKQLKGCMNI
jgi:hypothetical protein